MGWHPPTWNQWIVFGWLLFFGVFMGLDFVAMILKDERIPTFSRVVTHLLPWWATVGLSIVLAIHMALCYIGRR